MQADIDNILRLNDSVNNYLMENRKAIWTKFIKVINKKHNGDWPKGTVTYLLKQLSQRDAGGKLQPYIGMALYKLKKKL